jgi:hypothetical protein
MAEHMHAPTWDQLIKNIDTVVGTLNVVQLSTSP